MLLLVATLICQCVLMTSSEMFSSIATLQHLASQTDEIVQSMSNTCTDQDVNDKLSSIREWMAAEKSSAEQWTDAPYGFVQHPIAAINFIKLTVQLWELPIIQNLQLSSTSTFNVTQPEASDYEGAVEALVRIQRTYRMKSRLMAQGNIHNVTSAHGLDPKTCFDVGAQWMKTNHRLAKRWFDLLNPDDIEGASFELDLYEHRMEMYLETGDLDKTMGLLKKCREKDPDNFRLRTNEQYLENRIRQRGNERPTIKPLWRMQTKRDVAKYEALCRGKGQLNDIIKNKALVCLLRPGKLPYIVYKEEIHSLDPRISLIYDVITDKQVQMLQQEAIPKMYRAKVGKPEDRKVIKGRVGQLCWLKDNVTGVEALGRKVSDITGLRTAVLDELSEADAFQIVNYGVGGQYETHRDFYPASLRKQLPEFVRHSGPRIATFMFYLNEVAAGGATVFPDLGVRIPPVKHAAAFWYNFLPAVNAGDDRTIHAGCPVILGQKWVANKWIRQKAQMFRRPCGLSVDDREPLHPRRIA